MSQRSRSLAALTSPSDPVAAICAVHDEWLRREVAGEELADLCDVGIVLLPAAGPPVVGRAAVVRALAPGGARPASIGISGRTVEVRDDVAALAASFRTVIAGAAGPEVRGRHQWVLRRVDGRWRVSVVTWSFDAGPQPADSPEAGEAGASRPDTWR